MIAGTVTAAAPGALRWRKVAGEDGQGAQWHAALGAYAARIEERPRPVGPTQYQVRVSDAGGETVFCSTAAGIEPRSLKAAQLLGEVFLERAGLGRESLGGLVLASGGVRREVDREGREVRPSDLRAGRRRIPGASGAAGHGFVAGMTHAQVLDLARTRAPAVGRYAYLVDMWPRATGSTRARLCRILEESGEFVCQQRPRRGSRGRPIVAVRTAVLGADGGDGGGR